MHRPFTALLNTMTMTFALSVISCSGGLTSPAAGGSSSGSTTTDSTTAATTTSTAGTSTGSSPTTTSTPTFLATLDSDDTAAWTKADWANKGMFNCGWLPEHITFASGAMTIMLNAASSYEKPYTSGEYRTNKTFSYGTFETRMKPARASGIVSSFFLYTDSPWDEIDIEFLGKNTTQVQFNYYVNGVGLHEKIIDLGFDASTAFHTYAIEYGNGYINWYVDGTKKWGVTSASGTMPSHPMQIMMNLWPGTGVDDWLGSFSYSSPLYAYYDYVKYTAK